MSTPTISVIIPTFNSAALVTAAVDSALAQTAPATEILVIDDGSTDNTRERLSLYGNRIRYLHQPNRGVAAARNLGLKEATGEFIAFLDADDVWHPRKLERQIAAIAANPDISLLATTTSNWPNDSPVDPPAARAVHRMTWQKLAVKNHLVTSSIIVRRAALAQVGDFDTALHGPEDHDLWLRIAETAAVAILDAPLTGYRDTPGSLSRQPQTMRAGMRQILRKLDQRGVWGDQRWLRRKAYGYCDYSCAYMAGAAGLPAQALGDLARSIFWYPLPYHRSEVRFPLARLRMLPMNLARLLRLRRN
jgi:glycosyltransferase involved in cell wall biosynthesis